MSYAVLLVILFGSVYYAWRHEEWCMRDIDEKSNLDCLIDKVYETVHLHGYMLICSTQFVMLENVKIG